MKIVCFFILLSFFYSCQEGLVPEKELITTLKGTIHYVGGVNNFPDSSECYGIYVVAFKSYPKDSSSIFNEIFAGNVYLKFESQPFPVDSSIFEIEIKNAPTILEYIVVSMQTDSVKYDSQKVIGVYTETNDNTKYSSLFFKKGVTKHIDITVDFDNLPPQPFKR